MSGKLKSYLVFLYGLPGLPLAMLGLPLFVYLPSYYSQNLGLSLTAVGLALLLARSLDVITDPIIGLLNDRYPEFRSVSWRRKSFIIAGIPLLLVGLNYLLRPEETATAFYLFFWSFVTYLGWTLINIPWLAVGAEISDDYHEKSALASSREIFAVIGTVAVISLPVLMSIETDIKSVLSMLANYLTFLVPLTLLPLLWVLSPKLLSGSKPDKQRPNNKKLFSKETFELLKHPAIKRLLPAYFINSIANALPATLFILFVSYVLQTPEMIGILLVSYFISAIVGIPFWLYLARKTDKHISWCTALYGSIASFIWVPFLNTGDFLSFLFICVASGFCLGADVVMPASIQADISQDISANKANKATQQSDDISNVKEGQNSTALLFGIWGLLTKLSLALAIGIAFPLLDMVGLKLDGSTTEGSSQIAVVTLVVLYALIPILFKIWVLFQMWHFPFNRSYFTTSRLEKLSLEMSPRQPATLLSTPLIEATTKSQTEEPIKAVKNVSTQEAHEKVGNHDDKYNSKINSHTISFVTNNERMQ
ncbi:MFS transporter [Cocleimonas flava]|uniref:Na+/melibiose symporter-like transporter n=1 Tax=Cocleimonas flava TaxID=634765 RepID=A0A4V2P9E2_9GAMM|nr:MFS transporter [Cocleimonas flava]TCJ89255.1 Na+/melibiose symporter-like transporter [Cocleimonas flava]